VQIEHGFYTHISEQKKFRKKNSAKLLLIIGMQQAIFDGGPIFAGMVATGSFTQYGESMGLLLTTLRQMKESYEVRKKLSIDTSRSIDDELCT
jgi:hypothetical protein